MSKDSAQNTDVIAEERKRWGFFGIPWTFTKYRLTKKKLLILKGFFKSTRNEILLYRVVDISYSRTLIQKMFGLGTITVYSHDVTNPELEIKNIKNSSFFLDSLSDAAENDRIRMKIRQSELIDSTMGHMSDLDID